MFTLTLCIPRLVGVITHDDPLSVDNIKKKNMSNFSAMREIIADMVEDAKKFFEFAQNFKFIQKKLDKQRDFLAKLCSKDHLRFFYSFCS